MLFWIAIEVSKWKQKMSVKMSKIWVIIVDHNPVLEAISSLKIQSKCDNDQRWDNNYLSAPAHDNILLMRITWNGWTRIRMWNWSLPQNFTKYLLQQIRPASSASELNCSYSSDTKCTHSGKSSTFALFLPKSKIRIFGSGTPRQKRDFGYGLFLQ